jgi:hypothetical protein
MVARGQRQELQRIWIEDGMFTGHPGSPRLPAGMLLGPAMPGWRA